VSPFLETEAPVAPRARDAGGGASVRRVSAAEGYKLWAPAYDRDPNPLLALEERQLTPLLPDLKQKAVIDVACGTGRWLEKLMDRGARSGFGVDLSRAMLAVARTKTRLAGRLVQGDGLRLPFKAGAADLVVCSLALGHLPDLAALARELARLSRLEADLYVTDLHPATRAKGWSTGFRHKGEAIEVATFLHPVEKVREAFARTGFEVAQLIEAPFGEPERSIFAETGKAHLFDDACRVPAVLICHFKRVDAGIMPYNAD